MLVVFFFLPVGEGSEAVEGLDAMKVRLGLALFACIACLWMTEALPLAVTALLVPVLGVVLGLSEVRAALSSFAAPPIYLFFGGFALASALSAQRLDFWLAGSLGKLGKGRFIPVCLLLFGGAAFLSMWMSNTATVAMMVPLALGILKQMRSEVSNVGDGLFLLLGLAYSSSIGGLGTIIGSPPNLIVARHLGLEFMDWIKLGIPVVAVLLPAMVGLLYLLLRPTRGATVQVEERDFVFTPMRCVTLGIFVATALSWVFSAQLGGLLGIKDDMDSWIALLAVVALVIAKVATWKQIEEGTDWGVLLLFGGGLALSAILGGSGASLFLARVLGGVIEGWPLWLMIGALVGFVIFLTELSSNTAIAALLAPIFLSMAGEFGLPATQLLMPLALAASCAFMMPVATPPNAIVFATGKIPQRSMMRVGLFLNLTFVVLLGLIGKLLF